MLTQSQFLLLILLYLSYPFSEIFEFISYLSGFHQFFSWWTYVFISSYDVFPQCSYCLHFLECLTDVFILIGIFDDTFLFTSTLCLLVLNVSVEKFDISIKLLLEDNLSFLDSQRILSSELNSAEYDLVLILLLHFLLEHFELFLPPDSGFPLFQGSFHFTIFLKKSVYTLKWGKIFQNLSEGCLSLQMNSFL